MATDKKGPRAKKLGAKKSEAKKPPAKRAAATAARATARKAAAAAPAPTPKTEPVRANALKPSKKLAEIALMGRTADTFEKSLNAAVPAAAAFNHKLVDIAQTNMNAGMALVRDLVGAKSPWEMMLLGMTHWHDNMGLLTAQTRELRTLSSAFMASANEPIRAHLRGV